MARPEVQMRALVRAETMVGSLKRGDVFWCTKPQALHFIENKIAEVVGATKTQPQETKPDAPSVTKVEEPEVKKSLVEGQDGRSTDSVALNESGKTEPLSVSLQDSALTPSPKRTSPFSGLIRNKRR